MFSSVPAVPVGAPPSAAPPLPASAPARRAPAVEEVREDPEDGGLRTFEETAAKYRDRYSAQQIKEWWDFEMIAHEGEDIHNIAGDPFLTHASRVPPSPGRGEAGEASRSGAATMYPGPPQVAELADVLSDPFLANDRYAGADVKEDPFLMHASQGASLVLPIGTKGDREDRRQQLAQAVAKARRHWTESFYRVLGPGDDRRDQRSLQLLVLGPWFAFVWVLLTWLLVRRFSDAVVFGVTVLMLLVSVGAMLSWYQGRRSGPVSLLAAGALGIVAISGGAVAGYYGWELYWRQFWWTQTGFRDVATTASTPAMARADSAVLDFWDAHRGGTRNDSRVDFSRAAGYKDTKFYCVAPILSPIVSGASLVRVNFWAVGVNCCQKYGHFQCDDSREWDAGKAVVMLGPGYPCPECEAEKFRAAVVKAEAAHGLVSADGARFVRWVKDPSATVRSMLFSCLGFVLAVSAVAAIVLSPAGWLLWYYGVGVEWGGEDALLAATEAALRRGPLGAGGAGSARELDAPTLRASARKQAA